MEKPKPKIMVDKREDRYVYNGQTWSIDEYITSIQQLKEEGWEAISFYIDDDLNISMSLTAKRLETDKEYQDRLEQEKRAEEISRADRAIAKERRRKQYQQLRKEFEQEEIV
jgi:hypothetical protein